MWSPADRPGRLWAVSRWLPTKFRFADRPWRHWTFPTPSGGGGSRAHTRPSRTPPNVSEEDSPEAQCPPPPVRKLPSVAGRENRASAAVGRPQHRAAGGAKMAGGCGQEAAGIVADPAAKWRPCGQVRRAGLYGRRDSVWSCCRDERPFGLAPQLLSLSPRNSGPWWLKPTSTDFCAGAGGEGACLPVGRELGALRGSGGFPEAHLCTPGTYPRYTLGDPRIQPYNACAPSTHRRLTHGTLPKPTTIAR